MAIEGVKRISHQTLTVPNNLHVCGSRANGRLLSACGLEFSQCDRVLDLRGGAAKCHFVLTDVTLMRGNRFNLCECFNLQPSVADKYLKR